MVDRILLSADTGYSISKPIVDAMVGPSIRIHAINKVLCKTGPYLTIRINRFQSISSDELTTHGLAPAQIFDYLHSAVLSGQTVLIGGEVGTGKTTLVRALASRLKKEEAILVIEDTPEIQIEHPYVRYVHTREANAVGAGEIPLASCIRAGMRMAMNRILLGEIRDPKDAEAFVDVCVSGHPGLSTIHARSSYDAIRRLELFLGRRQPGVNRDVHRDQIAIALQIVVSLRICPRTGKRRITEVTELAPSDSDRPNVQTIFRYGVFEGEAGWQLINNKSFFEHEIREMTGRDPLEGLPDAFGLETHPS